MDASKILFRCSSLGHLMTEPKTVKAREAGELSDSTKTHCVDVYVSNKYNRFTEINAKQLDKGNDTEEDSITIVSRITKDFYKKNGVYLKNDYIHGTPDLFKGPSIEKAKIIRDTKSSWDAYSFYRAKAKALNKLYFWQGTGYMWLTGADVCYIDYCLNNTPWSLILRELYKESFNHIDNKTPAWIELQIIANHVYDKETFELFWKSREFIELDQNAQAIIESFVPIPLEERHFSFEFEKSQVDIENLKVKIGKARNYIENILFKTKEEN